ncbi:uncharacterized protein TNCV_1667551 [Trichonephila clavipes]|nr:uncharacterized protein TNCV_1667551 [Trichonephila clavipes]
MPRSGIRWGSLNVLENRESGGHPNSDPNSFFSITTRTEGSVERFFCHSFLHLERDAFRLASADQTMAREKNGNVMQFNSTRITDGINCLQERKSKLYVYVAHPVKWLTTLTAVPLGLGSNPGEDMDVCKCIMPSWQRVFVNSRRAASPLVRLVEGEERWEAPGCSF